MVKQFISVSIRIFTAVLTAVLLLALFLNMFTLWGIGQVKQGESVNFGYFNAIVGSGSMEPTMSMNDLLLIKSAHSYYEEDIITYVSLQGRLITHRIKKASAQEYVTQGDANNLPDEAISRQRVLGKVVFAIPGVGAIINAILSPTGIILLVSLFLLVYLIQRIISGHEDDEQKKHKIISLFLLLLFLVVSLKTAQETLGRYLTTLVADDSAEVAKFDVIITPPEELVSAQDKDSLEYYFISNKDINGSIFQVYNNGEVDVLCVPYLSNDITYRIYVSEVQCTEFVVKAKETVDFWLLIAPYGLDTNIKESELFIDIRQIEGG